MLLHLNASSGVPVYRQLQAQVKQAVAAGALRRGEALPSTRKLAAELRINPNTVARLPAPGTRRGDAERAGRRDVCGRRPARTAEKRKVKRLRPHARQLAVEGRQMRLTREALVKLLEEELDKLGGQP